MSAKDRSGHAIVLGASIAGLLAARVLSESFEKVTIFDRDELPLNHDNRRGVPHGEHTHGLLAFGRKALEELFDGFAADITALGAVPVDLGRDLLWFGDGLRFPRTDARLMGLGVSRPMLEGYVRDRIRALSNVEIHDRTEALGLLTDDDRSRVTGARVLPRGGEALEVSADLVVDATGRGNRGPTWLSQIGYAKPVEDAVDSVAGYASREYRRVPGDADFSGFVLNPWPEHPTGAVAMAVDGDRWMVTLVGYDSRNFPPSDPDGFLEFVRRLPHPELYELLSRSEPLGPPIKMRLPVSVRRRYERMRRLPEGLISIGDAICAFNPAYGQGMTVAAAEALVLRECLAKGRAGLPRRFYAKTAKLIDVPWDMAVGADLRYGHVLGTRSAKTNLLNGYVARLFVAAAKHPSVAKAFLSVANLMAPPQSLFAPAVVARVLRAGARPQLPVAAKAPVRELEPVG
ncbi:FAD-dependent oxidoreductase [Allorhizocola rhizosphaerae]|uniref:FAD-dependent oxidoreductase n=1 Tax=Allorhizocola rhizosphaerae TaxID=1872709 RepID=UPI0013C2D6D3|nr:FAD-binding protein [Allorhizocola rhizosphaerae]